MQSFITEGETVLIKFPHLIRIVSSYRRNLNRIKLILISKGKYKIGLYRTYFNSLFQVFCKICVAS
jgi:hypothetical protein